MSTPIDKKTLEHLAELSRIELDKESEEKLLKDLQKILTYFEELKGLDTENIEPMAGGTIEKNVFREDALTQINADNTQINADNISENQRKNLRKSAIVEQFPEEENGFLKVPAVFE